MCEHIVAQVQQKAPVTINAANKNYENFAYIDAIQTYERIAEKGYKSVDMFEKLGNSYYFNAELEKAAKWYRELFALNATNIDPEYYYRYAQSLKTIGDYKLSDEVMEKFSAFSSNDERAVLYKLNKNYIETIKLNSGRFVIQDAGINSKFSDYGSALTESALVFASAREIKGVKLNIMRWTNRPFTDLYQSLFKADGTLGSPSRITKELNSIFNESTPIYTKDGTTMYFTRNNYLNGKREADEKSITLLKLYKATKKGDNWEDVVELPFNSNQYSCAHPALSPDEKYLYFASDMPGTYGLSDLWRVTIEGNNVYGKCENLGKNINTPGRESFPFVNDANELYFATDSRPGLGGLDIFVSEIAADNSIGECINIGAPVNSKDDDFGLLMYNKTRSGFFTSNREGGKGNDDIYKFIEIKKMTCEQTLNGVITDSKTNEILPGVEVVLQDSKFNILETVIIDSFGNYSFKVLCATKYYVKAKLLDRNTSEVAVTTPKQSGKTEQPIKLDKKITVVTTDDDIAVALGIKMIYFDLDKSAIRKDATIELEKILDVMKINPTMKIDVRSHTDSRQTFAYNAALSSRRAKSTVAWLVKNGINANRLTYKGYGESKLTNNCADNVKCTEQQHQANRRSEFIITSM